MFSYLFLIVSTLFSFISIFYLHVIANIFRFCGCLIAVSATMGTYFYYFHSGMIESLVIKANRQVSIHTQAIEDVKSQFVSKAIIAREFCASMDKLEWLGLGMCLVFIFLLAFFSFCIFTLN